MEMETFKLPSNMAPALYSKALWSKTLACSWLYAEYILEGIFIVRLADFHSQWYVFLLEFQEMIDDPLFSVTCRFTQDAQRRNVSSSDLKLK